MKLPGWLMSTTAPAPQHWAGEIRIFWTIPELRAFGLSWKEIERDAMRNNIKWDETERNDA